MITAPMGAKADQTTANNLARAIADCEITKTVEEKADDLAPFGLTSRRSRSPLPITRARRCPDSRSAKTRR